jgi:outer membrane protein OmpA-like peptidoglycan-associated protein
MFVEIVGNIDDMLDPAHNKFLSENRAATIQEYLLKKGIDEKRVIAVGYTDDGANNSNIEERIEHFKPAFHIVSNMNFNYNRDKLKTHSTGKVKHHKHGEPMVGGFLHESIYFPENESMSLHKFSSHQLQHIMSLLNKYPSLKIRVEAHYDEDGDLKHNQHLAMDREKVVYDELIKLGVDSQRLALTAYPDKPTRSVNAGHENSLKNRRIKFRVLSF